MFFELSDLILTGSEESVTARKEEYVEHHVLSIVRLQHEKYKIDVRELIARLVEQIPVVDLARTDHVPPFMQV